MTTSCSSSDKPWYKDWRYYLFMFPGPGSQRRFSAEEMARAGGQPWPKGVGQYLYANIVVLLAINWSRMDGRLAGVLVPLVFFLTWGALAIARKLWREPNRRNLFWANAAAALAFLVLAVVLRLWREPANEKLTMLLLALMLSAMTLAMSSWWFLTLYRVQQIEGRLRELDDQEAQRRLTTRLATAQIHPHFVFNTLASLTHWVETQDPRAAPLLKDFSAYLRATLPMFERESQSLREELELVRRYLAIMAARLGERLRWDIVHDAALDELQLPPGSLLTLVENAITHGIEPSLRGGSVRVLTEQVGGVVRLHVQDQGQGLDGEPQPGLGITNTLARLQALHGAAATVHLQPLPPQGCEARIELPHNA